MEGIFGVGQGAEPRRVGDAHTGGAEGAVIGDGAALAGGAMGQHMGDHVVGAQEEGRPGGDAGGIRRLRGYPPAALVRVAEGEKVVLPEAHGIADSLHIFSGDWVIVKMHASPALCLPHAAGAQRAQEQGVLAHRPAGDFAAYAGEAVAQILDMISYIFSVEKFRERSLCCGMPA